MDRPTESGPAVPSRAGVVVIGAGIVGNCLVGHLAELGWDDLVLIDKGPLPDPGGSTGHASNFIFPTDHNREIAMLTLESQRQYEALGVNTTCGGVEVARTEERMEELRRRMTSARSWGIETELLTPDEVVARVPFVNGDVIKGGFYTPAVSVVDSVKAGTIMRERASGQGRADRAGQHRGDRAGGGAPPVRASAHLRRGDRPRHHRGSAGGDRLRRMEPAPRRHGRRQYSAYPGGAPDGGSWARST